MIHSREYYKQIAKENKIKAIRCYREDSMCFLLESKNFIEELIAEDIDAKYIRSLCDIEDKDEAKRRVTRLLIYIRNLVLVNNKITNHTLYSYQYDGDFWCSSKISKTLELALRMLTEKGFTTVRDCNNKIVISW